MHNFILVGWSSVEEEMYLALLYVQTVLSAKSDDLPPLPFEDRLKGTKSFRSTLAEGRRRTDTTAVAV